MFRAWPDAGVSSQDEQTLPAQKADLGMRLLAASDRSAGET